MDQFQKSMLNEKSQTQRNRYSLVTIKAHEQTKRICSGGNQKSVLSWEVPAGRCMSEFSHSGWM